MSLHLFFIIAAAFFSHSGESDLLHAYSPGDIVIGGLFPFHIQTDRNTTHGPSTCSVFDLASFLQSQVMIYAIREINQRSPRVLPNITLGYDIYDTCGDVGLAIRATLQLLKGHSDPQSCLVPTNFQSALPDSNTKAVIGERHSEVSIAVARVVALSSVTQISYASTSELLSRKLKFPTFLRTISSDEYQTKAITELVEKFNWKSVAIVGSYDEYGKYGSEKLLDYLRKMKDVCIEFIEILPGYFSHNDHQASMKQDELVRKINESSAEATILFTHESNVEIIMRAVIRHKLNRTWIASDSWSTSTKIATLPNIESVGQVFGFISKRNEVPGFKDYVLSKFSNTTNAILQHYLQQYPLCSRQFGKNQGTRCSLTNIKCLDLKCLASYIDQDQSYNIYLAVQVIAEGLRHLLKCDSNHCERSLNFTALELLLEIKKVNFTVSTTRIDFDSRGEPSLGYDIVFWDMTKASIETIGEYWPRGKIEVSGDLVKQMSSVQVTAFNCSKTCKPGQELKRRGKTCCNNCVPCADRDFSPGNGEKCKHCTRRMYSSPLKDRCVDKKDKYLEWSDPFIIILSCLSVFGIVAVIVFLVLFTLNHSTPIVKAVGGYLCFLELLSLLVCFCLTFTFGGKPSRASCKLGLPLFGIFSSLCFSCILANLLQILVGFNFDARIGLWIKKLNKPAVIVVIISGIQVALCVPWLLFYPPSPAEEILTDSILKQCTKGRQVFFLAMIGYSAFLALICFLFAYKGKQLPDLYKNASLISTSMMLFLIIWLLFIPIYISMFGEHKRAIESSAILIFSYSILGCHLAPKCYIMVFRKELNNERAITEYIRKHYERKDIPVVKS
ncbi:G-protein coupled receptor family C group 6 member A-like [Xyrichtys novacula]|uniref:G-protein coupled receptor family C group 6 member A n=1 Tax=Xyrichtys novacula TaxID=13765 RepID=A0AAV1GJ79_XYRNO|nr:G-protein coupled receptor family C group 6 member A-like [Xyrichtys novacula]